jgi:hypothetical protein
VAAALQGVSREEFISGVARDVAGKVPEPFDLPLLKKEIGIPSPTQVCTYIHMLRIWVRVTVVSSGLMCNLCLTCVCLSVLFAYVSMSSFMPGRFARPSN